MSDETKTAPDGGNPDMTPEARIEDLKAQVRAVGAEARRYRHARNDALRMGAALRTVLAAHGVNHKPDAEALDGLTIANGEVVGEYAYRAPTPEPATSPSPSSGSSGGGDFTDEAIQSMSPAEYERNRDAILAQMGRKDK